MLREVTTNVPYLGWSSAYSVLSIIMQIQSFLLETNVDQDNGTTKKVSYSADSIRRTKEVAAALVCSCGHSKGHPFPELPEMKDDKVSYPKFKDVRTRVTSPKYRVIYTDQLMSLASYKLRDDWRHNCNVSPSC